MRLLPGRDIETRQRLRHQIETQAIGGDVESLENYAIQATALTELEGLNELERLNELESFIDQKTVGTKGSWNRNEEVDIAIRGERARERKKM